MRMSSETEAKASGLFKTKKAKEKEKASYVRVNIYNLLTKQRCEAFNENVKKKLCNLLQLNNFFQI
jgi:hypothetical protein